jgi:Ni/Co efflux regulator RcnB
MRKLILGAIALAIFVPGTASAQTAEIRKDERQVSEQNEQLQRAIETGDPRQIEEQARDARKAGQELREDQDHFARNQYVAPYSNWTYSSPEPGTKLRSRFYSERYNVAHPDSYELHSVKHHQRWVRYGDDLLLVNIRTGRVIEVATGRF